MDLLVFWIVGFVLLPGTLGFFLRAPAGYVVWLVLVGLAVVSQASVDAAFVVPVLAAGGASTAMVAAGAWLRRRRSAPAQHAERR